MPLPSIVMIGICLLLDNPQPNSKSLHSDFTKCIFEISNEPLVVVLNNLTRSLTFLDKKFGFSVANNLKSSTHTHTHTPNWCCFTVSAIRD